MERTGTGASTTESWTKPQSRCVGAVLAGGAGSRLGGAKAMVKLAGRPLISYPLAAIEQADLEPVVVAKACTELPSNRGAGRPRPDGCIPCTG